MVATAAIVFLTSTLGAAGGEAPASEGDRPAVRKAGPAPWSPPEPDAAPGAAPAAKADPELAAAEQTAPATGASAESPRPRNTFVSVQPLQFLTTVVNLELEQHAVPWFSLYGKGGVSVIGLAWYWQAGGRLYASRSAGGWTPFVDLHGLQSHAQFADQFDNRIGGGASIGMRQVGQSGFMLSVAAGADMVQVHATTTSVSGYLSCGSYFCFPSVDVVTYETRQLTVAPSFHAAIGFGF